MYWLERWLQKEAKGWSVLGWIIISVLLIFLYSAAVGLLIDRVVGSDSENEWNLLRAADKAPHISFWGVFVIIFMYFCFASREEILFRWLPFTIVCLEKFNFKTVITTAIISSVIFGYLHGGFIHIFVQGIGGFIFCLLYLKCGGYHNRNIKAVFVSTSAHALYNVLLIALIIAISSFFYLYLYALLLRRAKL